METKTFKWATHKTLSPRTAKEGFKAATRKRKDINIANEVLATRSATGQLFRDMIPFITPGIQLNDTLRKQARENLGVALHHAVALAKLLKVKVPGSSKKIKTRTPTVILTEIERSAGEVFDTFFSSVSGSKVVPMTDEEKALAQKKYDDAEVKRKAKFDARPASEKKTIKNSEGKELVVDVPKGDYKPGKAPDFTKVVAQPLNDALIKTQLEHLLHGLYEFAWSMATVGGVVPEGFKPVAEIFKTRIDSIKGQYPEGFFTPPPKKQAPPGLKPPQKKKKVEAAAAPATPVAEAVKA